MYTNKVNFGKQKYIWNPWFGCFKITEACANCFILPQDSFEDIYYPLPFKDLPIGTIITVSLQSDFFLKEADKYREKAWEEIRNHPDWIFLIITKRIDRVAKCLPPDWGDGWNNVIISATVENQKRADERIPILLDLPIKHKWLACTPLLEPITVEAYLQTGQIEVVEVLGEKAYLMQARPLKYEWVKHLQEQCISADVRFSLLFLGHNFVMPDGKVLGDCCNSYHSAAADSLNLSYYKPITFKLSSSTKVY